MSSNISPDHSYTDRLGRQLASIFRRWRRLNDDAFRGAGFSQATREPLLMLYDCGRPMQQRELAEHLGLEPTALVRVIKLLLAGGWICSNCDPQDKRGKWLSLSPSGHAQAEVILRENRRIEAHLIQDVSPEEMQVFRSVLAKMRARLPDG